MEKRLIGTGTTDANGNVIIPYVGTGAGLVNLVAEATINGSFVSKTVLVFDCFLYDTSSKFSVTLKEKLKFKVKRRNLICHLLFTCSV